MNKIILTAEAELKDNELREWIHILERKLDRINERTKKQTEDIRRLKKELKEKLNK